MKEELEILSTKLVQAKCFKRLGAASVYAFNGSEPPLPLTLLKVKEIDNEI